MASRELAPLALGFFLLSCGRPPAPMDVEAHLTRVEGAVYIHLPEHPARHFIAAEAGIPLAAGDILRTGKDGAAELTFEDGSVIEVGEASDFIIGSLDRPEREFHLGVGHLAAKVSALAQGETFHFHTANAVAAIRGTELAVARPDDGPTHVGVFGDGHVVVRSQEEGRPELVHLGPGQETSVQAGAPPEPARPLRVLREHMEHVEHVRSSFPSARRRWSSLRGRRREIRKRLLARAATHADQLRNVEAEHRRRTYQNLREWKEVLKGS